MEYIKVKTIVTRTKSAEWFGIDYNMNIYRGCCHGCIYCDSRSECYQIENFDQVKVKENALKLIRDDLRRKVKKGVVGTGAMSDPYNPFEKEQKLTRRALELIDAFGFGAAIATKSTLLQRDLDILSGIKEHSPVLCKITITTPDDKLSKKIEPYAPPSRERFELIHTLSESGIYAGVLLMPVLPFLEDDEQSLKKLVTLAHESGAKFIYAGLGVTLRQNQREYFYNKLASIFPEKDLVGLYKQRYGSKYQCSCPNSSKLWKTLTKECEKYGILYNMKDIIHNYKLKYQYTQLNLFDL